MVVILQENFSILLGRIEVMVPWVDDGSDYQVVCEQHILLLIPRIGANRDPVFGDSGNFSPFFTISGA
jgi:hypothetical protein